MMSNEDRPRNSTWTIVAAVGGLLSGVAAVLALFVSKPDTLRLILPTQVLQEVAGAPTREAASNPTAAAQTTETYHASGDAEDKQTAPPTPSIDPPTVGPAQDLGGGVSASILSVAEDDSRFIATFRIQNASQTEAGVAVLWHGGDTQMVLTDGLGGSCEMSDGGTLSTVQIEYDLGEGNFRMMQPGGHIQHTIVFGKNHCGSRISSDVPLAISGSFVVRERGEQRAVPATFEEIVRRRAQ